MGRVCVLTPSCAADRAGQPYPRQLGQHGVLPLPSDSDEDFAAVEPPAEGPEDAEDEEALHEGAVSAFEEAVAEPGAAGGDDRAGRSCE